MGRYQFELATDADDAELQYILEATPMPGNISVTFRREPSYFDAAVVDGAFRQVIICREGDSKRIVGFGARSIREKYVNGRPTSIGYLSMLRALQQYRNLGLVARGYKFFRNLHTDGRTELYLTTIAEGNHRAISMLTSGRAGLPRYYPAGKYHTVAIPIMKQPRTPPASKSVLVRPATHADLGAILDFLERIGPERQFFPQYQASDFFHSEGTFKDMNPSDLLLAFQKEQLVGTLGGWDQNQFRQTVVERYNAALRWTRPVYNCWASLCGRPQLPRPGESFHTMTAALPVVENNDREVFTTLLAALLARPATRQCDFLLLGLHEADGLLPLVSMRGNTSYVTQLYHACWEDGEALRSRLDRRAPYLELGCL